MRRGNTRGKARKTLQLVDRPPGMAKSSPAHFGDFQTAGRRHRHQRDGCLIPHAACGMFIGFDAVNPGKIEHIAAFCHGLCKRRRFFFCHSLKKNGHHHSGHLIVRYLIRRIFRRHICNFLRTERGTVSFFHNQIIHSHRTNILYDLFFPAFTCDMVLRSTPKCEKSRNIIKDRKSLKFSAL